MTTPVRHFTDLELSGITSSDHMNSASFLEMQLAQLIIDDRVAFRQLIKNIEPMAQRVISPKDNTFSRQLELIKARL